MFVRFLSVALLGASVCKAALSGGNANTLHELRLQCTPCAFADQHCKQDAYLVCPDLYQEREIARLILWQILSLTTQKNTLLANDHAIFPVPPKDRHGHFAAVRYWNSRTSRETQDVQVAYTLTITQSDAVGHGVPQDQVKDVEMTLVDTRGNLVTPNPLYITLIQDTDKVVISKIGVRQHKLAPAPPQTKATKAAKLNVWVNHWKSQIGSYMVTGKEVAGWSSGHSQLQNIPHDTHDTTPEDNTRKEGHHPHRHRPHKGSEYRPYRGDHAVRHLLRPVLLPAILGILAGFVACIVGFVMGRLAVVSYFQARRIPVVRDEEQEGEESIEMSGKEVLESRV